jgi:hypothetical protein
MELEIQLSFVKTSEFWGGGRLKPPPKHPLPPQYATDQKNPPSHSILGVTFDLQITIYYNGM